MDIPIDDQLAELDRELAMRRRLYPQWVSRGTLSQAAADRQIRRLEAARDTVRKARQDAQMSLLNGKRMDET